MTASTLNYADTSDLGGRCHAGVTDLAVNLQPTDALLFPNHKRVFSQYATDDSGATVLRLFYGEKEIDFDDPSLFAFGEQLARQDQFLAGAAIEWGNGYAWSQVSTLLSELLEEGVLRLVKETASQASCPGGRRPSQLPPAQCTEPRSWFQCAQIIRELTGRELELGYLELVIPIYRIAHIAIDGDGRQVGEANVFPQALRLDIPTEWRSCPHAGSRYQDDLPMNVTALKAMRKHWAQTMACLGRIRRAFVRRYPAAAERPTLGDLQRLSTLVLALPAYLTLRKHNPVGNYALHPVLSSMFRVTDGLRMATQFMMFMPLDDRTLPPDAVLGAADIYAYVEQNNLFLSDFGVCAGPQAMVEEFLRVLVHGESSHNAEEFVFDPEVEAALADLEPAFDYALYGLQVFATVNCLWPVMSRACDRLWDIVARWPGEENETFVRFRASLEEKVRFLREESIVGTEALRSARQAAYHDMYVNAERGLGGHSDANLLTDLQLPKAEAQHAEAGIQMQRLLAQRFGYSAPEDCAALGELTDALLHYFREEQALVRAACAVQPRINALLGRSTPRAAFLASDIYLYFRMQDGPRRLPYLDVEELESILNINVAISSERIDIADALAPVV